MDTVYRYSHYKILLSMFLVFLITFCTACRNSERTHSSISDSENYTVGNLLNSGYVAQDENAIYYNKLDGQSTYLYRENKDGSGKQKIAEGAFLCINIVNDYIFYLDGSDMLNGCNLYKMKKDGTDKQLLAEGVYKMVVDNRMIYFIKTEGHALYAMDHQGNNLRQLHGGRISNLIVYGNYIYFIDATNPYPLEFCRMDSSGTNKVTLLQGHFKRVWVYKDYIICIDTTQIRRYDMNGENEEILEEGPPVVVATPSNIQNDCLYYMTVSGDLHSHNLVTGQNDVIAHFNKNIILFAVNDRLIFYQNDIVYQMNFDGSNRKVL